REVGLDTVPGEVVVPLKDFETMADRSYELLDSMKMDGAIIGIMCDRNTVMFMPYYFLDSGSFLQMTSFAFSKKVGDISMEYGGRGLGFGALFSSNLEVIRGKDNARQMKAIKMALDKNEVMNPGKLLEMQTRYGIGISPKLFGLAMDGMGLAKKALPKNEDFDRKAEVYEDERKKKGLGGHQH
ncbi:MAG: hypothetical protein MUE65_06835, partial [Methanomassiliicoccales archaeon]|nr:hypothetical protein [Methanomassiliicoccales archaeon]